MYRTKEQVGWDNKNTANYAGGRREGIKEARMEMALEITITGGIFREYSERVRRLGRTLGSF